MTMADTAPRTLDEAAQDACDEIGLQWRPGIKADGTFYRLDVIDDRRGKGDGSIRLYTDGSGGMVRNWKTDEQLFFWVDGGNRPLSHEERLARQRQQESAQKAAEAERDRRYREAAGKAKRLHFVASPAKVDHPYFQRKGVKIAGDIRQISSEKAAEIIGVYGCGSVDLAGEILVVPVTIGDEIASVHLIDEGGNKAFLVGGRKQGG